MVVAEAPPGVTASALAAAAIKTRRIFVQPAAAVALLLVIFGE
jgi:hypothetical protein